MYNKNRGFMKDMNRADLLSMREGGMSNAAIAASVGCSKATIYSLIGAQPPEISKRNRELGYASMRKENREKTSEGGTPWNARCTATCGVKSRRKTLNRRLCSW